jgi:hypothetical protein
MKRTILATLFAAGLALSIPISAFADDCHNLSRPAPADPTQLVTAGNWVWVPAGFFGGGQPEQGAWYFAVPGGFVATQILGTPDANGNYTNGSTDMLLGNSANCRGTTSRQTSHGIQNECTLGTP